MPAGRAPRGEPPGYGGRQRSCAAWLGEDAERRHPSRLDIHRAEY